MIRLNYATESSITDINTLKSIFGMTQHGIDKLEPNREIDYGD